MGEADAGFLEGHHPEETLQRYWRGREKTLNSMQTAHIVTDQFGPEAPDEWGPGIEANGEN